MELIERAGFLALLEKKFSTVEHGEGHCIFVSGEAGIGKTSLVKTFCKELKKDYSIYTGTCDALFTPRPLAPLYDIILQMNSDVWKSNAGVPDRTELFSNFFHELSKQNKAFVIVFEDIHWADEATLDFIKFLARRITQLKCLFILTYRDSEIYQQHPLRNVFGQLSADSFTRIQVPALSMQAVEKLAVDKGYNAADIYKISGGNPFYVNEILASYSTGVPDNIKDSVLSVYNRQDEETKYIWQLFSVLPTGFEMKYIGVINPAFTTAAENSLTAGIFILKNDLVSFKHELYRRTIEASLSPLLRVALNKKVIDLFRDRFEQSKQIERIVHHAKNANQYDLVVQYAPIAAKAAALLGAHIEASKLYLTAIEYYQGKDKDLLIELYEGCAYECYLTNQMKQAIIYAGKSLQLWQEKNEPEKIGNCLWFLSRLWWFEGNRKNAEDFARQAIDVLEEQPLSKAKAMAYSNMSQLKAQADQADEGVFWGEKAFAMAKEVGDERTVAHALNSMGSTLMLYPSSLQKGIDLLQQSLAIALKNNFHEHVARAYTAMGSNGVTIKDYPFAKTNLDAGIQYCEEIDLDSIKIYMLGWKARMLLETGDWQEAKTLADALIKNENLLPVTKVGALIVIATIKMRRGDTDAITLLMLAKNTAFETSELQRIIPVLIALLEYEWITGQRHIDDGTFDKTIDMFREVRKISRKSRLYFWLKKVRSQYLPANEIYEDFDIANVTDGLQEAALWEKLGCFYEQALCLFEKNEEDKRKAIIIIQELGADAVYEKMKLEMRSSGIKSIPRGMRKSTQQNAAQLTSRELDVLQLLKEGLQNKEIGAKLFISAKTVDHHISSLLFKLDVNSRIKAVHEAVRLEIIK